MTPVTFAPLIDDWKEMRKVDGDMANLRTRNCLPLPVLLNENASALQMNGEVDE
jgi:hypothetical protein